MALFTIVVWGITFVSTKVLLVHGLNPAEIMLYRFAVAYLLLIPFTAGRRPLTSLRDELLFLALGVSGGSLYFIAENLALDYTLTSNVAVLVCTAPLFTALLARLFPGGGGGAISWWGSGLALGGAVLVVFNGRFVLHVEPLGDFLSLLAAVAWGFYSIILRMLDRRYDTLFITRKVFFYGLLTLLPILYFMPPRAGVDVIFTPVVGWNLLFLGVLASSICYVLWNLAVRGLGAVRASNYIYLNPIVTLVASAILLSERVTALAVLGTLLILSGVYLSDRRGAG
jgi:drug/metabolite transporter (DMT)-like permease